MSQTKDGEKRLEELVLRALNQIRKPSTAAELAELLNGELGSSDCPVDRESVEASLRRAGRQALPLYWLAVRRRR